MNLSIDLELLKKLELELLTAVDKICQQENFRYSLGGGTLLGAVRHQGFIPWDDDIDIMMPRPDYLAFLNYCATHNVPFAVKSWENDSSYVDLSAKVYNPDTVLEDSDVQSNKSIGVFIDIFPIEGLGNSYKSAKKAFRTTALKRELLVAAQWKTFFKSKTHPWYYEPIRFVLFVLSRFVNQQKLFASVVQKYENINFDQVNFVGAVGGAYREKEILPREVFSEYGNLPFEGHKFMVIKGYETYLKSLYGNYMALPPEEKRVSHHTFKAYYKENK